MSGRPRIICLTPVKNEAWILEPFLQCTSLWADHIVIADQGSGDESRDICRKFKKVRLVENSSRQFDERARQQLLLSEARKFPAPRFLVTLDADEVLTANFEDSLDWECALRVSPGTVVTFRWVNIHPDLSRGWDPGIDFPWGYMDDGSNHVGNLIHSPRIPIPANARKLILKQVRVLHYQFTDWDRMRSKHRWYQFQEALLRPERSSIDVYRQYHHMDCLKKDALFSLDENWFAGYEKRGISMRKINKQDKYWYDRESLAFMAQKGFGDFRNLSVWDVDWSRLAIDHDMPGPIADPRSPFDKMVHKWLKQTQRHYPRFWVRKADWVLKKIGY